MSPASSGPLAAPIRSSREPPVVKRVFLLPAALLPLWHLAAPAGAVDPGWVWWATGGSFFLVAGLSLVVPAVDRHLLGWFHVCSGLINLQFLVLSALNGMAPFFSVAWAMSVAITIPSIRSRSNLVRYGLFLVVVSAGFYLADPYPLKLAYWGGVLPLVPAWYMRLWRQEQAALRAREHREELELRVQERTAELAEANRRLRAEMEERARLQKQLRLSQTMEAVGRLAGGVAHEFNNLLTTIRLYAELGQARVPEDGPVYADLAQILKAAQEAGAVTEQLLDFSRGADAEHEVVDLNSLVGDAVSMLQALVGDAVRICTDLEDGELRVWSASGPLERILLNLVLNARDAMPSGGRLDIATERLEPGDPRVRALASPLSAPAYALLAVCDTGTGMDAETRERIFDPFFSRKPVRRGAGLGLSIVYGIVRQTDGHIGVESEAGKGTRIEIIWPCTERSGAPARTTAAATPRRGNERILLVEDEPELRSAIAQVLGGAGYRVSEVGGAEEALAALAAAREPEARVDLVVSDVVMPGVGGTALAECVGREHPGVPVLLISGRGDPPARSGASHVSFLRKPFRSETLCRKVREVLDAAGS